MSPIQLNRRQLLRAAATAGGAALLAGCSTPGDKTTGGATTAATLAYWDWYVSQAPWVQNEIKLFQKAHSGIAIKKTTQVTDKYPDLMALAVRSGTAPDVFLLPKAPKLEDQVSQGWLTPLDKWATPAWQARFPEGSFVEGVNVFDGKIYSAPFSALAPSLQLYIHHGVFKEAGLVNPDGTVFVPKTWDDITRAAEAIATKSGGKVFGLGFGNAQKGALPWLIELFCRGAGSPGGTQSVDYRTGKWTYGTDRNYADFLTLLLDWKKRNFIYPSSMSISDEQARAYFAKGRFGMIVGGVWNQPAWEEGGFTDYSLVTLPSPTGTPQAFFYGFPGGYLGAISAKAKHPDDAWAWLDWFYSKEAGKRWVEGGYGLSIYPDNNDPAAVTSPTFKQYVAMAGTAINGPVPAIRNPDIAKVEVAPAQPDIPDVAAGIYTGQLKDVPKALKELEDRLNDALSTAVAKAKGQGLKVSMADYAFADWDPAKPYTTKRG
ncbi:ABC transporter substrate-binding protein [Sphaerisporangium corydalis]|uniref:Extracellular solute-binding protein n=1 Tax=Sphaerisporangium corydalis TaxID=1441875 RepID=A0ABV9EEV6_9ACTN|nr:extracellular solute-binding protein [Sphaerisporangium corydalis]